MNLLITLEARYDRTPDGAVWSPGGMAYPFWKRYLSRFDRVIVASRVREVEEAGPDYERVDGDGVEVFPLPYYWGPRQYLAQRAPLRAAIRQALSPATQACLFRVPSMIAAVALSELNRSGRPFGLEVIGDPVGVYGRGGVRHPLRRFWRWYFSRALRRQCRQAAAVSYVTERFLQERYPPSPDAFSIPCSDVELGAEAFVPAPRTHRRPATRLIAVGSLDQMYKGPDTLLEALRLCRHRGSRPTLRWIGDGKHRSQMEALARDYMIDPHVEFVGRLPSGDAVRRELDQAELFVLPSRTEGLPRALIEAMARGLPCIGTNVGGIPELLPEEETVEPGDPRALAEKLMECCGDTQRLDRMSARNLARSESYRDETLQRTRDEFYGCLRERAEAWRGREFAAPRS